MKIAQVVPLFESSSPRRYGGTERIVSYLTEELRCPAEPSAPPCRQPRPWSGSNPARRSVRPRHRGPATADVGDQEIQTVAGRRAQVLRSEPRANVAAAVPHGLNAPPEPCLTPPQRFSVADHLPHLYGHLGRPNVR